MLVHRVRADEDEFLPPVAPDGIGRAGDGLARRLVLRPMLLRNRGPPQAEPAAAHQSAGLAHLSDMMRPRGDPEEALGADDARPALIKEGLEAGGVKRALRPVDEGADAVFLGFGNVALEAVQLLEPQRMFARLLEIEQAGAEDIRQRDPAEIGLDDAGRAVQAADDLAGGEQVRGARRTRLVEHDHVRELDLLDQQFHQRAVVVLAGRFAALCQEILRAVILEQVGGIDHRDHRVEAGDIRQAPAVLVAEVEGGGDRQRLRNAAGFDQQIVEALHFGETAHLLEEVVAQRATDAAIRHFHQLLAGA